MADLNHQDLKYGIIYLYSDPRYSSGFHEPESIVKKFVYPMQIEWIDDPGRDDLLLIARRFNVGNMGRYATVSLSLSRMNRSGGWFEAIRHFADALMGVADAGDGDIVINESDYGYRYFDQSSVFGEAPCATPQDHTRVENRSKPSFWKRMKEKVDEKLQDISLDEAIGGTVKPSVSCTREETPTDYTSKPDLLQLEEDREVKQLEQERKKALEQIKHQIVSYIARYHEDPKELISELLRGKVVVGQPGRLLVNGDMKIVLPEYDETEIEMPAMCRTIYILFMKLRKQGGGIVLRNIDEYRNEILAIYTLVKPGANEYRIKQSVDNLCDPSCDSLHQTISRINRCIKNVITDKELVKRYIITGRKGKPYSIALEPEYLELPRAVTGE